MRNWSVYHASCAVKTHLQ